MDIKDLTFMRKDITPEQHIDYCFSVVGNTAIELAKRYKYEKAHSLRAIECIYCRDDNVVGILLYNPASGQYRLRVSSDDEEIRALMEQAVLALC